MNPQIMTFLASAAFAVVGASTERHKYGNKVLHCYLQHQRTVYPVNPHATQIEGLTCYPTIAMLPAKVNSISIITPPSITETIVTQAILKGIENIWMQPGAESETAISTCQQHQVNVIAAGPCILVVLGYQE